MKITIGYCLLVSAGITSASLINVNSNNSGNRLLQRAGTTTTKPPTVKPASGSGSKPVKAQPKVQPKAQPKAQPKGGSSAPKSSGYRLVQMTQKNGQVVHTYSRYGKAPTTKVRRTDSQPTPAYNTPYEIDVMNSNNNGDILQQYQQPAFSKYAAPKSHGSRRHRPHTRAIYTPRTAPIIRTSIVSQPLAGVQPTPAGKPVSTTPEQLTQQNRIQSGYSAAAVEAPSSSSAAPSSSMDTEMLNAVNSARKSAGKPPLKLAPNMNAAAMNQAKYMDSKKTLTHDHSGYSSLRQRFEASKVKCSGIAENVASLNGDVAGAMRAWMNSPGHRANILGNYEWLGWAKSGQYWAQSFCSSMQ